MGASVSRPGASDKSSKYHEEPFCTSANCSCHHKNVMDLFLEESFLPDEAKKGSDIERAKGQLRTSKSLENLQTINEMTVELRARKSILRGNSFSKSIDDVKPKVVRESVIDSVPRLKFIIDELVSNEENYVKNLARGIKNYLVPMDDPDIPDAIRELKAKIFSNITDIYEFHANTFYPALVASDCTILKITEMIDTMLTNGNFYCYVVFTLNKEQSETLCETHGNFFQDLQKATKDDKLGVGSFLLQPIQRLPHYQLLLSELIKVLMKNYHHFNTLKYLAPVCKTEKNFAKLLNLINESLAINEIDPCGLPIDLFSIGQFRKTGTFDIYDRTLRRNYHGKLLYFEQCLVYTETVGQKLMYRGHFEIGKFCLADYDANDKFSLVGGQPCGHMVDFRSDICQLEAWYDILQTLL